MVEVGFIRDLTNHIPLAKYSRWTLKMLNQQPVLVVSCVFGLAGPAAVYAFADDERQTYAAKSLPGVTPINSSK
jgi:hypothetical protein